MAKIVKFIVVSLLSLVIITSVIIGGVLLLVDPNEYKDEISAAVQDKTGRQLTIDGEIKLSLYPWIGMSLGSTQLSNASSFGNKPFASVDSIDVKVKLLPLLQQRVEMQKIRLIGLNANLAINKAGRSNWDDLVNQPTAKTTEKPSESPTPQETVNSRKATPDQPFTALAALAIDGLELENAQLEWNNQQNNQHIVIDNLTLRTGPLVLPAPTDINMSLDVAMKQPEMSSHINFSGQVSANLESQQFNVNQLDLQVKASGADLPVSSIEAQLKANVKADLTQQQIRLSELMLNTLDTKTSGQAVISDLDSAPSVKGQIAVDNFSLREVAKKLDIALPETSDKSVLTKVNMNVDFDGNLKEVNLTKITASLDDSTLSGVVNLKNFEAPAVRFDLHIDDIDADRYLPSAMDSSTTKPAPVVSSMDSTDMETAALPLAALRALDVKGDFKLDKLKFTGARSTDISLSANAKNGKITLYPIKASLYNGSYNGNVVVDVRSDTPKLSFNESLKGVNVGPLLKDTFGKELVSGTANASAQITARGSELSAIKKTVNGKARFSFRDGAVKGVNIAQMIREANAKLNEKPAPPKTTNETDFAEMTGSVTITNGLVRNKDLVAKSPLLRIHGKGTANLSTEKIKYLINTSIVKSDKGQAGEELKNLKSLTIPIKVTGTISKPKYGLDLGRVLQEKTKKAVDKKKKQLKKEIDKKAKEEKKKLKKKLEQDLKKKLGIKF